MKRAQSNGFFYSSVRTVLVLAISSLLSQVSPSTTAANSYLPAKFQTQEPIKRKLSLAYDPPPVIKLTRISGVDSADFPNDFEVEIKNIGDKPIYFMYLYLDLPEVEIGGSHWVFIIQYGRGELLELRNTANADDVPIKPGEVHTLKIPTNQLNNFAKLMKELEPTRSEALKITKVQLSPFLINFGDGTGYILGKPNGKQVGQ
ncbi:MAG: hypothetical protein HYR56_04250 [Acidobacteria bacterium]|nr:hypothetical protein [Acidobacteriota bacterium]MBI3423780.1 hypothetical protein [Acidobacteriota bacterium]